MTDTASGRRSLCRTRATKDKLLIWRTFWDRVHLSSIKVNRRKLLLLAADLFATAGSPAPAADAEAGRALAGPCRVCHGLDGAGTNPTVPNIGGQSAEYLQKALLDFREGRRVNEQMSIVAEGLSDDDISHLAAWYSSIVASFALPD